jgi:hypothetical protein
MDNILPVLAPHLDWDSFSVRIAEADIAALPSILKGLVTSGAAKVRAALP